MNEIRLLKGLEPLKVEVESPGSLPSSPASTGDPDLIVPGTGELPPSAEFRIEDRRVAQRYKAIEGRCWIGWKDGGGFRQSAAWILNISITGSLIATDELPPTNRSVWLRLENSAVPDWAEARILDHQASQSGIHSARLVFRGTCPYTFIKAVAFTSSAQQARTGPSTAWNLNAW